MRRRFPPLLLAVALLAAGPALACLWDSDTLAMEAEGLPDVVQILTGRFERNPPLYFEMRLERAARELEADPTRLELYDDAGVAGDRLGRPTEAIAWMARKAEQLARLPQGSDEWREHQYRYLANLGTFYAHRWFQNGAPRTDLADLERGRDLIAAAIELNPDAHFGRERYQLQAMEALLDPPAFDPEELWLPDLFDLRSPSRKPADYDEPIEGLAGLVVLGAAWESLDIFYALQVALAHRYHTSLAHLAAFRCAELVDAGRGSAIPGAPTGDELRALVTDGGVGVLPEHDEDLPGLYALLREEADAWHEARTAYMLARLEAGSHPDTEPAFWDEWEDPGPPPLPDPPPPPPPPGPLLWLGAGALALALGVGGAAVLILFRRR